MSTRTQRRGRGVATKKNSMTPFYMIIGVVVIVGAVIGLLLRSGGEQPVEPVVAPSLEQFQSKGNPDAAVTVVEYSDFQCPGCAVYALGLGQQIEQNYIEPGLINFVYHEMSGVGPNSLPAAEAGRCAAEQESFWPMHDLLFQNQQQWSPLPEPVGQFTLYAQQLELDTNEFDQCLEEQRYSAELQGAALAAQEAQITSVPTFVVNGQQFDSDELVAAIDAALAADTESDTLDETGGAEAPGE